jgi:hypothetical protein
MNLHKEIPALIFSDICMRFPLCKAPNDRQLKLTAQRRAGAASGTIIRFDSYHAPH